MNRSDEIFLKELAESDKYVDLAVKWYTKQGHKAYKGMTFVRPTYEERFDYSDTGDLFVPGCGWVDVKHRDVDFPPYPFADVFTITKHAYERTPCWQYMIINRKCTHALIINGWENRDWREVHTVGNSGSPLTLFTVPIELCKLVEL